MTPSLPLSSLNHAWLSLILPVTSSGKRHPERADRQGDAPDGFPPLSACPCWAVAVFSPACLLYADNGHYLYRAVRAVLMNFTSGRRLALTQALPPPPPPPQWRLAMLLCGGPNLTPVFCMQAMHTTSTEQRPASRKAGSRWLHTTGGADRLVAEHCAGQPGPRAPAHGGGGRHRPL